MSESSKTLKSSVGAPFWIGCLVGPILFIMFLAVLRVFHDSFTFWFSACIAVVVFGPVGGLIFQVIHDLFIARRLRLLRVWDYAVFAAIGVALFVAGFALFHTSDKNADIDVFKNRTFDIAGAFVALLVSIYAIFDSIAHFSSRQSSHIINTDSLRYAGFAPRLASLMLDFVIWLPLGALMLWGDSQYRLFSVYYLFPGTLFGLFYSVYLVRHFGGTPGKLIVGIRIRKLDGEPVGYREAFLRYCPEFIFGLLISVALLFPLFHMSDTDYYSLSFMERSKRIIELAPSWYKPLQWTENIWVWGELIVLLTNRKRRALHDFIAGTVVVYTSPDKRTGCKS